MSVSARNGSEATASSAMTSHQRRSRIPISANGMTVGLRTANAAGHHQIVPSATAAVAQMTGLPKTNLAGEYGPGEAQRDGDPGPRPGPVPPHDPGDDGRRDDRPQPRTEVAEREEQIDEDRRIEHVAELDRVRPVELAILVPAVARLPAIEGAHVDPVVDGERAREPVDGADQRDDPDGDRQRQQADGDRPADLPPTRRLERGPTHGREYAAPDYDAVDVALPRAARYAAGPVRAHRRVRPRAHHRARHADPPPDHRPTGRRPRVLRRRRPAQRGPAALRPAGRHGRCRLLSLPAAPGGRLPAAGHAPVPDRRAHLGGAPARPVRRHDLADRRPQSLDLDRPRLARRAVRVEPRGRPGTGRGHVPRRARAPRGRSPSRPTSRSCPRSSRSTGWAGATGGHSPRSWPGVSACSRSRSCSSRRARSRSSGSRTSGRSATSRTARCTRSRRGSGRRSSPASWRWPCATPRAGSAGTWRSRCRSSRTRGCSCTSSRRCWPRCGRRMRMRDAESAESAVPSEVQG